MKSTVKLGALVFGVALAACAASSDEPKTDEADATSEDFYGADRVGAMLKWHPEKIPAGYEAFEKLFGVGRACTRIDSKEIFVVEEKQTRLPGPKELHEVTETPLMPRAVITGCNTDAASSMSVRASYSLMAALISDPNKPGASEGDTMSLSPLEVALDEKTGLYNFYVFEPADPNATVTAETKGRVTRIFRTIETRPDRAGIGKFNVFQRRLEAGKPVTPPIQPIGGGNRCFNCHVNGAPIMNEIRHPEGTGPWANWVSSMKTLPVSRLSGVTQELVGEATPNATTGRSSLANELERIIREGSLAFVFGSTRTNGWGRATLEGTLPGGPRHALEAVFCQTELSYATASSSFPIEIWLDPDVADIAGTKPPPSFGDDSLAFQFATRSVHDKQVESWLVQKEFLGAATARAIRLIDDESDVFSPQRCEMLDGMGEIPVEPAKMHEHVRTFVLSKLDGLPFATTQPKRHAYMKALLTPGIRREEAEREYKAELSARFEKMDKSDNAIRARERSRKARAREMFQGRSVPLPILTPR